MTPRILTPVFATLALMTFVVGGIAVAADKTHDGKVVSVTAGAEGKDGKLVMTDKDGKSEHTHSIPPATKITLNGKSVTLTELKKGDAVKVTTDSDGKVTEVAATRSVG
jgi:hypothetical protein